MKKTLLITALIFAFVTNTICVNAQAGCEMIPKEEFEINDAFVQMIQEEPERIYEQYSNVIDIQEIALSDSQISKCAQAYQYKEDGTIQEAECDVTLNKVIYQDVTSVFNATPENTSTLYILTATATSKESDSSTTKNGVTLYGCIGWIDNLGINNKFEYVRGSRSGSYSGQGRFDALNGTTTLCGAYFDDSFYSTSNSNHTTGLTFRLNIQSGTGFNLNFTTSMFD